MNSKNKTLPGFALEMLQVNHVARRAPTQNTLQLADAIRRWKATYEKATSRAMLMRTRAPGSF